MDPGLLTPGPALGTCSALRACPGSQRPFLEPQTPGPVGGGFQSFALGEARRNDGWQGNVGSWWCQLVLGQDLPARGPAGRGWPPSAGSGKLRLKTQPEAVQGDGVRPG